MIVTNDQPPQRESSVAGIVGSTTTTAPGADTDLLAIARQAEQNHETTFPQRSAAWERSYRAYNNQHFAASKYNTREYRSRSKLFVPKTRSAVRSKQASAAAALFSTDDVVSVTPEVDDDERQRASAALIHELLNYRMDRSSPRGGMPWFAISMGAHMNALMTNVCCSKQEWEYEEKEVGRNPVMIPAMDEATGQPIVNPLSGEPVMVDSGQTEPVMRVIRDRPMVNLFPPENVIVDLSANWYDPAQESGYLILRCPMTLGDLKRMMRRGKANLKSRVKWRDIDDSTLMTNAAKYTDKGVRIARDSRGNDKLDSPTRAVNDFSIVWPHENFIRTEEGDKHFWSIGSQVLLSEPTDVEDVYPAFRGDRPVVYGYGALEAHNVAAMAPVEAQQPLQQEINDSRNLRLDAAKQAVLPFATVKRGQNVDVSVLGRLAPGAHTLVTNHEDVNFRELPSGSAGLFPETAHLNTDFDELAGLFSGSAVQNNRQLNETVGGMRLLSGSANAVTEFDLRVWTETWVEPVIRQCVHLEQYYESDETVIAVAAERAKLFQRFGVDEVTDELLTSEVTVKVNVGIGALDPMQKIAKLTNGLGILEKVLPLAEPKVVPNSEEIVSEVMGAIGYKDGKRFFHWPDPAQPPPDEGNGEAEAMMAAQQQEIEGELEQTRIQSETDVEVATIKEKGAKEREAMKIKGALAQTIIKARADVGARRHATQATERTGRLQAMLRGAAERSPAAQ